MKKSMILCFYAAFCLTIQVTRANPINSLAADVGQKTMPFEYVQVPDDPDSFYHVQRTRPGDNRLFLTANNVYFNPINRLVADGQGPEEIKEEGVGVANFKGRGINQRASFAYIRRWNQGDRAVWGLWLENAGRLDVFMQTGNAAGANFSVNIDNQNKHFTSKADDDGGVRLAGHQTFDISKPGFYEITVECLNPDANNDVHLHWLELSGPAAVKGGVVRVRWRPSAAHAQFSSSKIDAPVRMWIMELDAVPGKHNFYGPLTTPFGYYGSSWWADGRVAPNLNFSLWSYGRHAEEPPIEMLSQIVAVGHPEARFGGFGHEGTGVKVRGWRPFEGRQGQRQAYALRVEPGKPSENYDTYYAYFYANDKRQWILYGIGENFNKGRADGRRGPADEMSLRLGSFVEVVGGARRERTGIFERRQRYRGWLMDMHGQWFPVNRMTYGNVNNETGLTHTDRGVTADGWFWNQTGGWTWRKPRGVGGEFVINENPAQMTDVSYLQPDDMQALMSVPAEIEVTQITRDGASITIQFSIRNAGQRNEITAYWGPKDGRALQDRWAYSKVIARDVDEGTNEATIVKGDISADGDLYIRLFLKNDVGQFFSRQTFHQSLK